MFLDFIRHEFHNLLFSAQNKTDFFKRAGFKSIQFPGEEDGLSPERLGYPLAEVGAMMHDVGLEAVMEIVVRHSWGIVPVLPFPQRLGFVPDAW